VGGIALRPFGDAAWRASLPEGANSRAVLDALRAVPRVVDAIVTERHAVVTFDAGAAAPDGVSAAIERALSATSTESTPREHIVRVRYGPPDLEELARRAGMSPADVIALHANRSYVVAIIGFLPGFAYLRGLDPRLVAPRRATPRPRIEALSVGVAGPYTGVYPLSSPGGWNIIGTALAFSPFDVRSGAALALGFGKPVIEIATATGLATIQDGGRPGYMHQGVPPGGPLVPELLSRANAAVSDAPGEAAIEALGAITIVARGAILVASDDGHTLALQSGETFSLAGGPSAVRYLAVRGGIDVPLVLGGRGTLVVARLGGHEGRPLRRGDLLRVAAAPLDVRAIPSPIDASAPVQVVLGPDLDRFSEHAIEHLFGSTFTIDARSDRVGARLKGPPLTSATDPASPSAPMVRGAIQVPPSGEPIVLGPDHPTTGGYPVIATVVRRCLGSVAARHTGAPIRFVIDETA
jgi:KipI family sensor histidine kinase inhibitor